MSTPLLKVDRFSVRYPQSGGGGWRTFAESEWLTAVDDVSFSLEPGRSLGIVGESGCGKSSLARALVGLTASSGTLSWKGKTLTDHTSDGPVIGRDVQMVFQDPLSALNPRIRIGDSIAEPLTTHWPEMSKHERSQRVQQTLERVGLEPSMAGRFPHEFSGGQAQRIVIGRAIISSPQLIICDEAVSALDVSVQALILSLLRELQQELGMSMLFISHDLAVVRQVSHDVMVMYQGRVCELAERDRFFTHAKHPYSTFLINSVLSLEPRQHHAATGIATAGKTSLPGDNSKAIAPEQMGGCPYQARCPLSVTTCLEQMPPLVTTHPLQMVACHQVPQKP
jgi:oligopeptide/dipeptide ABC transporter ATP-binding protein